MSIHTIKLPDVGEGVTEAEFVELHVKVGDMVEPDQNLVDVMTDKATVEVPSPRAGKVVWIGAEPGDTVAVGAEIIKIEMDDQAAEEAPTTESAPAPKQETKAEPAPAPAPSGGTSEYVIKLPDVGEGVTEAEIVEFHVKEGDTVEPDQNLADVMTDKATVEIPSPRKGTVSWIGAAPGDTVAVGAEIIKLAVEGKGGEAKPAAADVAPVVDQPAEIAQSGAVKGADPVPAAVSTAPKRSGGKVLAAPAVRARAMTKGIDLAEVQGTGPEGRVTHEDLDAFVKSGGQARPSHARPVGGTGSGPNTSTEEIKVIGLRRKIAEKMQAAKRHIPHITYVDEVDMTAVEELRQHMNKTKRDDQPKLTVLPFIAKAIVRALEDFPQMSAHYDDEAGIVTRYGAAHIGIATQTDNGLMVPVLRHAEAMDLHEMANEIARLSKAARDGSAKREELSGSSITITSLGPIGGITTTPIINRPEVAIVGPNKIQTLPRFNASGQVEARKIMNLSSSFDHRIIDGYEAAEFVQRIKGYLEFPATLFI
ncbi:2-oxo acid dehydrogenase subunit E2 [Parvularcula lutaonensis]|uniref:Dihydrolipoamide acetyltransferase component of pyruvate dehydrogenase complex n=1 Tax=Parvularcula lutaonensis TaxID=491923 RepID=A0ABV7MD61_9PROT|nr:2-oxo acid dehydrogenase subunit E2 [Parvularcula lutaonensis]GGY36095.1 lipoamide acyltransferase component of branched-chain alpha-keto acid dehydrogenase complex [Parvularcula lutaonensis]